MGDDNFNRFLHLAGTSALIIALGITLLLVR